LRLCSR